MTASKQMKLKLDMPGSVNPVAAFGVHDSNLRLLERLLAVRITPDENAVVLTGEESPVFRAEQVMRALFTLSRGSTPVSHEEIRVLVERGAASPDAPEAMSGSILVSRRGRVIKSRTANQASYIDDIMRHDLVFSIGPAGTGKTYLAIAAALHCLATRRVSRIILTRPVVEAGENLGFLPGTLEEKINPYLKPLFDAIAEMLSPGELDSLLDSQVIELAPLAYMRGRTLSNAFIILDEAQNTTHTQMKMFLTRLGEGSKMVVTGDITQIDLPGNVHSGLKQAVELFSEVPEIKFVTFDQKDVVRHGLVKKILDIYQKKEEAAWQKNS